jgi:hypothetical protein
LFSAGFVSLPKKEAQQQYVEFAWYFYLHHLKALKNRQIVTSA